MRYCGISEYFHDAAIAFITEQGNIEFAAQSERYTKKKNDSHLDISLVSMIKKEDKVAFYETYDHRFDKKVAYIVFNSFDYDLWVPHHTSHASIAYYTRPWESNSDTVCLTIDGLGEIKSTGIFDYKFNEIKNVNFMKSIGYFYSTITSLLGLRPLEDEYVVMGLSAYGEPKYFDKFLKLYEDLEEIEDRRWTARQNSVQKIRKEIKSIFKQIKEYPNKYADIAASIQKFAEIKILEYAQQARKYGSKLVYSGGVAQNVVANSLIRPLFDDMWIPTAPNDAGSSLGAAAYIYGMETGFDRINWEHPYLGYNIKREINPKEVVDHLLEHTYCGIANGRAEFGPRALGNRSLIADVRYDVKDTVNEIKRRQKYRPFAPAILEEFADQYFEGPMNEYMQYTSKALHDYKSVTHVDGTARVQVVKKDCKSIIRPILEEYYERTGVPMLLNTSLNIRGMPMVNDEKDAEDWEKKYKVKVF